MEFESRFNLSNYVLCKLLLAFGLKVIEMFDLRVFIII